MNFRDIAASLKTVGYSPRKADAKIAHDIVLKAIEDAGFHDQVTIKGGVVMSGITDAVRRATIDMDFVRDMTKAKTTYYEGIRCQSIVDALRDARAEGVIEGDRIYAAAVMANEKGLLTDEECSQFENQS